MATQEKKRRQAVAGATAFRSWFNSASIYAFVGKPVASISSSSSSSTSSSSSSSTSSSSSSTTSGDVDVYGGDETIQNENAIWSNMYGLKKLSIADVSHVIPISTWVSGTPYDMYHHNIEIATASATEPYFTSVVSGADMYVYKCISNGTDYATTVGENSTVSPYTAAGTSTSVSSPSADDYRWKFMYSITDYASNKFYNASWIPCSRVGATGSLQATVSAAATDRAIEHIKVTAAGSGYSTATVSITGDGSGATATATISSGQVTAITLTNRGTGYTSATVTVSGDGSGAIAEAVISPKWGHGYDPVNELAANSIMVVAEFDGSENGVISVENDYRQFGLVVNPTLYGTKTVATGSAYSQATTLNISAASGLTSTTYTADATITGDTSGASGSVLEWTATSSTAGVLKLTNVYGTFTATETINASSHTISSISNPSLEHGSGEIILAEEISPVSRSETQRDRIRMIFTF